MNKRCSSSTTLLCFDTLTIKVIPFVLSIAVTVITFILGLQLKTVEALLGSTAKLGEVIVLGMITQLKEVFTHLLITLSELKVYIVMKIKDTCPD